MDYVVVRTHVVNHARFLEAGAIARDLWAWGMLYAGQHETDGEIPMVAVLASPWGYGSKKNVLAANKLVEVGLWERSDRGFRVRKWTEQGNKTKAEIEGTRAVWREKAAAKRRRDSAPCPPLVVVSAPHPRESLQRTPSRVLNSPSLSSDLKRSTDQESLAEGAATRLDMPLSDSWRADAEGQIAPSGETVDVDAEWAKYVPDRLTKARQVTAADWRLWVRRAIGFAKTNRMRERERREAAERRREPPPGLIEHQKTKAEREADAERLVSFVVGGLKHRHGDQR